MFLSASFGRKDSGKVGRADLSKETDLFDKEGRERIEKKGRHVDTGRRRTTPTNKGDFSRR